MSRGIRPIGFLSSVREGLIGAACNGKPEEEVINFEEPEEEQFTLRVGESVAEERQRAAREERAASAEAGGSQGWLPSRQKLIAAGAG